MANLLMFSPISCISDEVLCIIFDSITSKYDLKNIMLACKRFLKLIRKRNRLWKRLSAAKDILDTIVNISSLSFPNGKPPLAVMDNLIVDKHPLELLEEELLVHIFHPQLEENLTTKFYAERLLEHVRIHTAQRRWKEVDTLLHGAVLISQWGLMEDQHLTSYDDVSQILDNITCRVRQIIDEKNLPKTAKEMLMSINKVLYGELSLQKYVLHKNSANFETVVFCIEKVLERRIGLPLILAIIYYEVAKRMGILCDLVYSPKIFRSFKEFSSTPHSFLLRWREFSDEEDVTYYYNDPCHGGASHRAPKSYSSVPVRNVFLGLVEHLLSVNVLDWQNQLHFQRLACIITIELDQASLVQKVQKYAMLSKRHGEQLEEAGQLLERVMNNQTIQSLIRECNVKFIKARVRNQKEKEDIKCRFPFVIKYAVGLVMMHKKTNVNGIQMDRLVVIYAWYCKPCLPVIYNVLFNNGNMHDVKEDELEIHPTPAAIKHQEIGIYFERFDGHRYIPNAEMKTKYPEDDVVALSLIQSPNQLTVNSSIPLLSEDNETLEKTERKKGRKSVSFNVSLS